MMNEMMPALKMFAVLTVITGVAYPIAVTAVAQGLFQKQANGSMIVVNEKQVGSELIGQDFKEERYFKARPSAVGYNPLPSGGSNAGPTSADLLKAINDRRDAGAIDDLLFASGSGLDPHISPEAAIHQIARVQRAGGLSEEHLKQLIEEHTELRTFGFLGEPRVNVLLLNLNLDRMMKNAAIPTESR